MLLLLLCLLLFMFAVGVSVNYPCAGTVPVCSQAGVPCRTVTAPRPGSLLGRQAVLPIGYRSCDNDRELLKRAYSTESGLYVTDCCRFFFNFHT